MQTKLTLRLEATLIRRAKAHARKHGKSVSALVADYFAALDRPSGAAAFDLPDRTRSLLGALRGTRVAEADWLRHLEEKHQ